MTADEIAARARRWATAGRIGAWLAFAVVLGAQLVFERDVPWVVYLLLAIPAQGDRLMTLLPAAAKVLKELK